MKFLPSSLSGRLIVGATLFTVVALGVTLVVMNRVLDRFVTGQIDQRLDNKLVELASQVRVATDGTITIVGDADGPPFDQPHHQSFWRVAGPRNAVESRWLKGETFATPTLAEITAHPAPPPPPQIERDAGLLPRATTLRLPGPRNSPMHLRVVIKTFSETPVTLLAAAPLRAIADPVREAMATIAAAVVALGIASLVAAFSLGRLVFRPLTRLRGEIADVRVGRLTALPADQPIEVRPLVDELNSLLAQNAINLARARKHVANLAHGLKTPLATLSLGAARLEGVDRARLMPLVETIERRVRHHLGRARAAALDGPVRSQTHLRERLRDIIDALQKIHADKRVAALLECPVSLLVACEPQDIDEILGNLLENAFKYTRSRVDCTAREVASKIVIEIVDDGPGLSGDDIARALRPGERLDEQVPGFGFGLPIARELVELYGGDLSLEGRGPGLLVKLTLPRSD